MKRNIIGLIDDFVIMVYIKAPINIIKARRN